MFRTCVSALALLAFVVVLAEGVSFCAYLLTNGTVLSLAEMRHQRQEAAQADNVISVKEVLQGQIKVLHPYLGYVYDATKRDFLHAGLAISDFGFPDDHSLIQRKSREKVIVGILGGSVAWWFQSLGYEALRAELQKVSSLANKEIVMVRMALGGFKQPQQLMANNYAMALGGQFDIVINLDGYNEVALHPIGGSVNPIFPHEWDTLASSTISRDKILLAGTIGVLKQHRAAVAGLFSGSLVQYSMTAAVLWQTIDRLYAGQIAEARRKYAEANDRGEGLPYAVTGPPFKYGSSEQYYSRLAEVWADSSLALRDVCEARGTKYFHFLQPNQYVKDSKPFLTKEERDIAFNPDSPWSLRASQGYPALIEEGHRLEKAGVHYHDLTTIFRHERRTMYADECCHISELGNAVLGKAIGEIVAKRIAAEPLQ